MSTISDKHKEGRQASKLGQQAIAKFNYYQSQYLISHPTKVSQITSTDNFHGQIQQFSTENIIIFIKRNKYTQLTPLKQPHNKIDAILAVLLKSYIKEGTSRIDNFYYRSTEVRMTFSIGTTIAKEMIEIVYCQFDRPDFRPSFSIEQKNCHQNSVNFYVIHHSDKINGEQQTSNNQLQWNNFVQRYRFTETEVIHETIASVKKECTYNPFQGNNSKLFKIFLDSSSSKLLAAEILTSLQKIKQSSERQISMKVNPESDTSADITTDPAFSDIHKRVLKLPIEHYQKFLSLKSQCSLKQNDICRFLFVNDYDYEQTRQVIFDYEIFRKNLNENNKIEDFQKYLDWKIFNYIGQDKCGRPVVLTVAENFLADEVDHQQYMKFVAYYFEVIIRSKARGYVDQYLSIMDFQNLSMTNVNFGLMKKSMSAGMKFGPQKVNKMFGINANTFTYYCYQTIKPFLPQRTINKVNIIGQKPQQIFQALSQQIDETVIPVYLGGSNPIHIRKRSKDLNH